MVLIGTSGYSYDDWVGPFYPAGMKKKDFLAWYSEHFKACEINFTYYTLPSARTIAGMIAKSNGRVTFTVKAHREMTHERGNWRDACGKFLFGIQPLVESRLLGCVLLQFPWSFRNTEENRSMLGRMADDFRDLPAVVEFRNSEWVQDATFEYMRGRRLGFCCVDEPKLKGLMPPLEEVTSEIAYVRFHGRNAAKWWKHEHEYERYDYRYSDEELKEWVPSLRRMDGRARLTFVFTNNHYRGNAVANAKRIGVLLDENPTGS